MLSDCLKCRKNAEIKNPKYCKDKKRKSNAFIKMQSVWWWKKKGNLSKSKKFVNYLIA